MCTCMFSSRLQLKLSSLIFRLIHILSLYWIEIKKRKKRERGRERASKRRRRKELERKISDLLIAATSVVRRHTAGHNEKQYGQDTWYGSAWSHLGDYPELKS